MNLIWISINNRISYFLFHLIRIIPFVLLYLTWSYLIISYLILSYPILGLVRSGSSDWQCSEYISKAADRILSIAIVPNLVWRVRWRFLLEKPKTIASNLLFNIKYCLSEGIVCLDISQRHETLPSNYHQHQHCTVSLSSMHIICYARGCRAVIFIWSHLIFTTKNQISSLLVI